MRILRLEAVIQILPKHVTENRCSNNEMYYCDDTNYGIALSQKILNHANNASFYTDFK
jgi:hypothetical protein